MSASEDPLNLEWAEEYFNYINGFQDPFHLKAKTKSHMSKFQETYSFLALCPWTFSGGCSASQRLHHDLDHTLLINADRSVCLASSKNVSIMTGKGRKIRKGAKGTWTKASLSRRFLEKQDIFQVSQKWPRFGKQRGSAAFTISFLAWLLGWVIVGIAGPNTVGCWQLMSAQRATSQRNLPHSWAWIKFNRQLNQPEHPHESHHLQKVNKPHQQLH